jgi:hypothetical protein
VYLFQLPHKFNPKNKIKKHSQYNSNNIFNQFQTKIIYIQQYIENILHTNFNNITTNNIEEHYIAELKIYKTTLKNILQVLPKKKKIHYIQQKNFYKYLKITNNSNRFITVFKMYKIYLNFQKLNT